MLNDADHDLLRRDTALPALRTLLEEDAFLARLQSVNPTRHLTSARLRYLRYKPGTSCLASYLVRHEDREYHVSGKAWLPGAHAKREKHQGTVLPADPTAFQGGSWPNQGLVIGVFPWDAKLGSLDHWATPDARHQFFAKRESLRSLAEAPGWTILNYKPERRLVARVEGNSGEPVAVLKAHTPQGFSAALAASRAVEVGQRFDLPRLLGKSTHHAAAVYAWQNGEGMDALLGQALADSGKVAEVGGALAELHGQSGSSLPELAASDLARQLPEHARVIAWLSPSCTDRARTLAAHLAVRLRNAPTDAGALHGDFYAKQVLFDGTRLVFLDLDSASRGPGWVDLANFIAHLELDVIRDRYPVDTARAVSEALVEGYLRVAPPGRDFDLSSPVAAALFAQAPHLFRSRVENWAEKLSRLLDRVSELAHTPGRVPRAHSAAAAVPTACEPQPPPAVQAESALADLDPAMPTLRSALDTVGMEARFRRMPGLSAELEGHTLVSAVVRRHKAGRRALIEYRFEADEGLGAFSWLGKVRSKSGRDWSDRVSRALRAAGLAEPSCVAVPETMGTLSDLNLELQRRVAGEAVTRLLLWPEAPVLAARCAEAISRLHASRVVVPRSHTVADELRVLEERLARLETSHPHHASRVARLRRACAELTEAIPAAQPTLIHRDFYPDQVLVDGRRLWLLDLDLCTMGDPCVDHGNFLAHLTEWSLRTLGRADALRVCEAAYREAALKSLGPGGAFRLEVYQTLSLARHVQLCTQFPERREWLPFLLELCEQRLSRPVRTLCC